MCQALGWALGTTQRPKQTKVLAMSRAPASGERGEELMKLKEQPATVWRHSIAGWGWSQCKGPEAGHA